MIEAITGRYMRLELEGRAHRLYFEEAGQGIPLLLLHTAGSGIGRKNLLPGPLTMLFPRFRRTTTPSFFSNLIVVVSVMISYSSAGHFRSNAASSN